jgi:hypothetical protein
MPKNLFLQQVRITSSAKNPNRALKSRPHYELVIIDDKMSQNPQYIVYQ